MRITGFLSLLSICLFGFCAQARVPFPDQDKILKVLSANAFFSITGIREWETTASRSEAFNIVVLIDNDSKWNNSATINSQILKSAEILRKSCGVKLQKALLVNVTFTAAGLAVLGNERPDPYVGPAEIAIARGGLPPNIITGVLVKNRTRERDVAYAFNRSSVERASLAGKDWSALLYSLWLSDKYILNPNSPQYLASYQTLAHELTHILGNLGHTDAYPNLMSNSESTGAKSGDLNAEQCSVIRKHMVR